MPAFGRGSLPIIIPSPQVFEGEGGGGGGGDAKGELGHEIEGNRLCRPVFHRVDVC